MVMMILTFRRETEASKERVEAFLKRIKTGHGDALIGENGKVYEVLLFNEIKDIPQWEFGQIKAIPIEEKDLKMTLEYWARSERCGIFSI